MYELRQYFRHFETTKPKTPAAPLDRAVELNARSSNVADDSTSPVIEALVNPSPIAQSEDPSKYVEPSSMVQESPKSSKKRRHRKKALWLWETITSSIAILKQVDGRSESHPMSICVDEIPPL